jgi:hypothetical protein
MQYRIVWLRMDFYEVADELGKIAKKTPKLDAAVVTAAPRLLALPRYAGVGGANLLVDEIAVAASRLPDDRLSHAAILLKLDANQDTNWSDRIKRIDEQSNGRGRWLYAKLILTCVANELCQLWRESDIPVKQQVFEPFERISYENKLEIDPNDHGALTEYRDIHLRVAAPAQRLITLPYYYLAPSKPRVEPLTPGLMYITSVPIPETRWGMHILNLPRRYKVGDHIRLQTREKYLDSKHQLIANNPQHGLHQLVAVASPNMSFIHVGVRLPPALAARAKPEAVIVTQDPFGQEIRAWGMKVDQDGWVNARFDKDLEPGCKCVLRFPGLDPHV